VGNQPADSESSKSKSKTTTATSTINPINSITADSVPTPQSGSPPTSPSSVPPDPTSLTTDTTLAGAPDPTLGAVNGVDDQPTNHQTTTTAQGMTNTRTTRMQTTSMQTASASPPTITPNTPQNQPLMEKAPIAMTASHSSDASSNTVSGDASAYLAAHNGFRAQHGASPLTWSTTLAAKAQEWANRCVFQHSGGSLGPYGGTHFL
jgi:hypothetical protein